MDLHRDLQLRILYILERSYTELGQLTLRGNTEQAYQLVQAMENLPRHLMKWQDHSLDEILRDLGAYKKRYPNAYEYLQILDPEYCGGEDLLE